MTAVLTDVGLPADKLGDVCVGETTLSFLLSLHHINAITNTLKEQSVDLLRREMSSSADFVLSKQTESTNSLFV